MSAFSRAPCGCSTSASSASAARSTRRRTTRSASRRCRSATCAWARLRAHLRLSGEERCPAGANRHRRGRLRGGLGAQAPARRWGRAARVQARRPLVRCHLRGINELIRELTGGPYSAKDFRTWNATVLAAVSLAVSAEVARSAPDESAPSRWPCATSPATSATRRLSAVPRTSIRGSSTASTPASPLPARSSMWEATGPAAPTSRLPNAIDAAVLGLLEGL